MNKYDKVFVVDVSFGNRTRFLFDEWKDKGTDVIWIDHHKTVINDMRDYEVKGKRRIGTAACELTWEYLFDDIETPNVVELLSAYDVWDHDRFEWSDVMAFQYGMRGYCGLDVDIGQVRESNAALFVELRGEASGETGRPRFVYIYHLVSSTL